MDSQKVSWAKKKTIKYGKTKTLHKKTLTDVFLASNLTQDIFQDKYIKLFFEISVLGKNKDFLEIFVMVNIKWIRFFCGVY